MKNRLSNYKFTIFMVLFALIVFSNEFFVMKGISHVFLGGGHALSAFGIWAIYRGLILIGILKLFSDGNDDDPSL